jgi:hypothetical protein
MIGKIKTLGLAFVALTAMSAVTASAVQASSLHLGASPAVLTGHSDPKVGGGFQQHILQIPGTGESAPFNSICDTASFEGTIQGQTVTEGTVTATYSQCKLAGTAATVQMNGCKYTLTGITGQGLAPRTFNADIVGCTAGKQIQIKTAVCTVDIPEQNNLSHLTANNEANNHLTVIATVTGITAKQTGAACPGGPEHHATNASFTGNTTVTGFVHKGTEQVTEHGHQFAKVKHANEAISLVAT